MTTPPSCCACSRALAPWSTEPYVVILTPGVHNSAYFEHSYLARLMGVQLVEGSDLTCEGGKVWLRSTSGLSRVDVIYRRIDDDSPRSPMLPP